MIDDLDALEQEYIAHRHDGLAPSRDAAIVLALIQRLRKLERVREAAKIGHWYQYADHAIDPVSCQLCVALDALDEK